MSENIPYQRIIKLLERAGVDYKLINHKPVYTNEEAEKITGLDLSKGMKCLLLEKGGKFVLAVIPGDQRLDMKKVGKLMGVKRVGLATKNEVEEKMLCELGGCYPFGNVVGLRTIADSSLLESDVLALNPGVNNRTIIIKAKDYFQVATPEISSIIVSDD